MPLLLLHACGAALSVPIKKPVLLWDWTRADLARARAPRASFMVWPAGPLGTNDRTRAAPQICTGAASAAVRPGPRAAVVG